MKCTVRGEQLDTTFVVADFSDEEADHLAALGFTVHGLTATRHVDEHSRHIDTAFQHLGEALPAMIDQHAGRCHVPWDDAVVRLTSRLDDADIEWGLIGTAALAIRGVRVQPGDVDIVTTSHGAVVLGELYRHELVFPVVDWPGAGLFGRAFDGCRVEWIGNDGESWTWTLAATCDTVDWRDRVVRVPPLAAQLHVEEQRGRVEHANAIRQVLAWQ